MKKELLHKLMDMALNVLSALLIAIIVYDAYQWTKLLIERCPRQESNLRVADQPEGVRSAQSTS